MREFENSTYKIVHMLRRHPGITPPNFQSLLLEVDLAAISKLPGLRRYGQNHALLQGYAKGELIFDAFEEFWFETADAYAQAAASLAWPILKPKNLASVGSLQAAVHVSVQKDAVVPVNAIRSTEFVNRRPDLPMRNFRGYWLESHGPLATHIPHIIRYEQNHLVDIEYAAGSPRFDGWAATWFTSTAAMRAAAASEAYQITRADEENFLKTPLPVLFTRERLVLVNA